MKIKIQWKLMISYLALVLLIGLILYLYLNHTLENYLLAELRDNLTSEARLISSMSSSEIADMQRDAPLVARSAGRAIKARVSIITGNGTVAGDSELTDNDRRKLENHADRPEFRQALGGKIGVSTRYSSTLATNMMYVALPFQTQSGETAVVRLALPLSRLETALTSLHTTLGGAILVGVLCSLLLSYAFSSFTSRPLRTMAETASLIGRGDLSRRLPVTSSDEVGELAVVMNEMAGRLQTELELISAEKNRLDTILRGMGEGLIVTDTRGNVTLANPTFCSLFSYGGDVAGKSLIELIRQPVIIETLRKVLDTKEEILEEMELHLPSERHILTHWVPLMEGGVLLGAVGVFHDISDLKRLEKIRTDFVANVSHELRTPVSVIKGYAETILNEGQGLPPEKALQFTGIIHSHAERLSNLISDLLILSRIESGALALETAAIHIDPVINLALRLLEQKAHTKGVSISKSEGLESAPPVLADPGRLEQVFVNLMDNALKFTPAGGSVTISATDAGSFLRIDIHDTGIGIPKQDLSRIFERFYRVDTARSRELGGTGLGLSIVKHIVQAHGGTVSVDSTPGKGSTFSFTLKKA